MKISHYSLSEVCEFIKDGTHGSPERTRTGVPVLSAEHVNDGRLSFLTSRFTTDQELKVFRKRLHPLPGDVLLTIVGTIGRTAVLRNTEPFLFQRSVCVLRPCANLLDSDYLRYALGSDAIKKQLNRETRQVAQAGIYLESLNEIEVSLPPFSEQKRIAYQLEKADHLRRTRRYALELSDDFLPAAFLEIFGDPKKNPHKWPETQLGNHLEFLTSGSRGWAAHYANHGEIFLRIQNVGRGKLLLEDLTYVQAPNNAEARRTKVRPGDVLLSITADLGRSAAIPANFPVAYINQHLALLRPCGFNPVFLSALLSCDAAKTKWNMIDRDAVKSGLNFDDVRGFRVIVPPLALQQQYASVVEQHERLRSVQRESLRQAEHLFQSLLHEAFSRELD